MNLFVKRIWVAALGLGVLGGLGTAAEAALIPVFSTGTTSTGALAATGSVDAHYALVSAPATAGTTAYVASNLPGVWVANTATSQWLAPSTNGSAYQLAGPYDYQTTFSLAGLDATTASIRGQVAADDSVVILLNGVNMGSFAGFSAFSNFALTSGFVAGTNTLDFIVTNTMAFAASPTGLQVNITAATANAANAVVPEPTSAVLLGLGGIAVVGIARRRRAAV